MPVNRSKDDYDHFDPDVVLAHMDDKCVCHSGRSPRYNLGLEKFICSRCGKEIIIFYSIMDMLRLAEKVWPDDQTRMRSLNAAVEASSGRADGLFEKLRNDLILENKD